MHNLALLTEGYAKVLTITPNDKYEARFERAERDAKNADCRALGQVRPRQDQS
jgi:endonuclease YncB( thermonuclease family)